jgi:hypothetical protein
MELSLPARVKKHMKKRKPLKDKKRTGYEIKLPKDKSFVMIDIKKPLPPETALVFTKEAAEIAKKNKINSFLIDIRKVRNDWSVLETYQFAQKLKEYGRQRLDKVALLIDPSDNTHSFMETTIINQGYNNHLFTDYDKAVSWLRA